jgi:hypothetical protein
MGVAVDTEDIPFDIAPEDRIPADLSSTRNTLGIILGILAGSALAAGAAYALLS